jgi:hypothetical protein
MHHKEARGIVFMTADDQFDIISGTPTLSDVTSETDQTTCHQRRRRREGMRREQMVVRPRKLSLSLV